MPSDQERALRERVTEQARLEREREVEALCRFILPAYRSSPEELGKSAESLGQFVAHVHSAALVSFEVEWWELAVERFGGASAALVRSAVQYNGLPKPAPFRTLWVRVGGEWHTTAVGKLWPAEPAPAPAPDPAA
jgi:hypothetical protein